MVDELLEGSCGIAVNQLTEVVVEGYSLKSHQCIEGSLAFFGEFSHSTLKFTAN